MPRSRKPGEHRYRVGNTIFRVTESRNRFNRFQKSGKELAPTGFAVENYALSVHRNSRKEFQSMLRLPPYSKKSKGYRMHHLFHTIQIKLHESAGVPLISPSPLAHFEE